jgi:methyl coenzyme M reductase beta subunit
MKIQERKSAGSAVLVLATAVVMIVGLQMFTAEVGFRVIAPSIFAETGCF